ncbi:hypothetical protein CEXT_52571 [Caerostris extrusa]|uniref:Uncharacterized protein n=1 Tax=Caerostris extrusa TaxID=172846 RepID=A0AAV4NEV6_CAEEX|nr:hypothetical protein CEXT_52571 [Caerostris extrusa]
MTIDELAQVEISHGSIHTILSDDLKMKHLHECKYYPAVSEPGLNENLAIDWGRAIILYHSVHGKKFNTHEQTSRNSLALDYELDSESVPNL